LAFLHSRLELDEDQRVQVSLAGHVANVFLLDDENYERYRRAESYIHRSGGFYSRSPAILKPPAPGAWHLIIDLAGSGEVTASFEVITAT